MNNSRLLVSVIIPAKNRHEFVEEALTSVFSQQTTKDVRMEVILVDNRSQPSLMSVLQDKFPKVKFVINDSYDSPGGSRNVGLRHSKGDYVTFLDSDDMWKKDFIDKSVKFILETESPATVCLTNPYFYGHFPTKYKYKILFLNFMKELFLLVCKILNNRKLPLSAYYLCQISHMLFDKKYINFKFNETVKAAEDWEFVAKISKHGNISILPERLVDFRYESKSNSFSLDVLNSKEHYYQEMLSRIPQTHKKGLFYVLFILYIKLLLVR